MTMNWGVNLSGAEGTPGGTRGLNFDYTYPTHDEIDYYASKGLNTIRLELLWERLQNNQFGSLNPTDMSYVDDLVGYAASKNINVVLDIHNYGYAFGSLVGSVGTPNSAFMDLWSKLASHFVSSTNVMFGLMNEPHTQTATEWLGSANAAISAIRQVGAKQTILVSGSYWDSASTWTGSDNAVVMGNGVLDPLHNYAFEVHQYMDADGSGTHSTVVSADIGAQRLKDVTRWAEETHNKLYLGEFAAAQDANSLEALKNMLAYVSQHTDVFIGATMHGAGPWWGDYMFALDPTGLGTNSVKDKPQVAILSSFAAADSQKSLTNLGNIANNIGDVGNTVPVSNLTPPDAARLDFHGGIDVIDPQGNASQVYRLYLAALNRTPEIEGLTWHVKQLDRGVSLHDEAASFIAAPEFVQRYGVVPSDAAFVKMLYANVLGRAPDASGQAYWTGHLADGLMDRATVLVGFSESVENHLRVDSSLVNGIRLDYGGIA